VSPLKVLPDVVMITLPKVKRASLPFAPNNKTVPRELVPFFTDVFIAEYLQAEMH
jgi:hypothetical protein